MLLLFCFFFCVFFFLFLVLLYIISIAIVNCIRDIKTEANGYDWSQCIVDWKPDWIRLESGESFFATVPIIINEEEQKKNKKYRISIQID